MSFPGYSPAALDFLRKLTRNNRRPWFQRRKHIYLRTMDKCAFEGAISARNVRYFFQR